ncbi:MAG: DUF3999 family protein [Cyclobacteriaceae bacterium]
MKRSDLIFVFLVLVSGHCLAQPQFRYKRSIGGVEKEGWYVLSLPSDIFKDISGDFSDLRLYSTSDHDTLELPYLLQVRHDEVTRDTVQLPLFNKSTKNGVLYLTFELKNSQRVNYIDLQFEELNYFGYVTIEGSNDQREWFEIVKDHRIVSVRNGGGDYTLSTVSFSLTDYRYLRAAVRADVPLTFKTTSFQLNKTDKGVYRDIPLTWKMRTDRKTRTSFVDIQLSSYVPISSISVETDSAADYYRSLQIEYLRDSAQTEKRWVKYYGPLYEGHLTSFTLNEFDFKWVPAKEIRLVIRDNDNAALPIREITAAGPDVQIVSYLRPGENFLFYGADAVRSPSYDLAWFENKIPAEPMVTEIGPPQQLIADGPRASALFENKVWLWSLIGVMIVGLGFFTIKMMKARG